MRFKSNQIKGKGRGRLLGFPTINLKIPKDFKLEDGIYAVKVLISGRTFLGALHFGPVPTFNESEKTLEVFLIDTKDSDIPAANKFELVIIRFLRPVFSFSGQDELAKQIRKDVEDTKKILNL